MQLDITIGILSYNRAGFLVEALQSVLNQSVQPKSIIIYDNGSKNDVYNAVQPFLNDSVHWVGADGTQNSLWNFSRAIKNVNTKYVMVFHDDDRLLPDFLQIQSTFIENNSKGLAFSANGVTIDENGERLNNLVINSPINFFYFKDQISIVNHSLVSCIPMSPTIYKSDIFKTISLNPRFGKCCDTGLYLDIIRMGPIMINNEPIYECRVHGSQDSSFFPLNDFQAIFEVFYSITANDINFIAESNNVYKKFTSIALSRIYKAIKNGKKQELMQELKLVIDYKFKIRYIFHFFKNRVNR